MANDVSLKKHLALKQECQGRASHVTAGKSMEKRRVCAKALRLKYVCFKDYCLWES